MKRLKGLNHTWTVKDDSIELDISDQIETGMKYLDLASEKCADRGIVITSGSELSVKHSHGTKHHAKNNKSGLGEAVDVRTYYYLPETVQAIMVEFYSDEQIRKNYDLVFEGNHFHLEYDPK